MKAAVLGTGSWGTALAQVLADNGNETVLWGRNQQETDDINLNHHNMKAFPDPLNPSLTASTDMHCIQDADLLLAAVPTSAIETVLNQAIACLDHPVIVINVAKGFHPVTHERMSVFIRRIMPAQYVKAIVSLIGPSHAEEVIQRKLTAINSVSEDEEAARTIQQLFSNDYVRVYRNTDVIGTEIGAALKNIMAIASGILEGIGQGDNARAALMTRGLAEMERYGVAFGAHPETFLGLDGVGDLIVTCTSRLSRNFMAGYQIGTENSADHFMKTNTKTVEGLSACRIVYEEAKERHIDMPITTAVYHVLYENSIPDQEITALMHRDLKSEEQR